RPPRFLPTQPATPHIYTLSLHDALPICRHHDRVIAGRRRVVGVRRRAANRRAVEVPLVAGGAARRERDAPAGAEGRRAAGGDRRDRKSTRLNSSHDQISYAVFCLKKKTT